VTKVAAGGMPVQYAYIGGDVAPFTPTTWNPADLVNVTLSGSNLVATGSGQGGVRAVKSQTSGKFYWEYTLGALVNSNTGVGFGNAAATLGNVGPTPFSAVLMYKPGTIYYNNLVSGINLGTRSSADKIGIALDIGAQLFWFRVAPVGNWNNSGTANPATGAGGFNFTGVPGALYPLVAPGASGDGATANFGGSGFTGAVPSGFTAGWG
jgi:hypothetical protein